MDLGNARVARIGVNILHDAIHPHIGLAWTDGQNVSVAPIIDRNIDGALSVRLGTFKQVCGVSWCRNVSSFKSSCLLCIALESEALILKVIGSPPEVHWEQAATIRLCAVIKCFIWNPLVDILCIMSTAECRFYVHRLQQTFAPFTLQLSNRSVSCGCWSQNGSILVIGVGTDILVYKWVDISISLDDFTCVSHSLLSGLSGDLCCIEFFSEEQFVCTTELPLNRLCIQQATDMFDLQDFTLRLNDDPLTVKLGDRSDKLISHNLSEETSLFDQLLGLPRIEKSLHADSACLHLMNMESHTLEIKILSSIIVLGLLSPDIMHICRDSASVFVGSNINNIVSHFKIIDGHLTCGGQMKLLDDERLKGLCSFHSLMSNKLTDSLVMITGQTPASESLFPPTSSVACYHLRLFCISDFMKFFKPQNLRDKDFTNQYSPEHRLLAKAEETDTDCFRLNSLCMPNPNTGLGIAKVPAIEIIKVLHTETSEGGLQSEELETECLDFETTVPHFNSFVTRSKTYSDHLVLKKNFNELKMKNEVLASPLKNRKVHARLGNASSSDVSDCRISNDSGIVLERPSVAFGGSECCRCENKLSRQLSDILNQLKELNLRFQIQERKLTEVLSTVERMPAVSRPSAHQSTSNPHLVHIVLRDSSDSNVTLSKYFVLENFHLKLKSVQEAFNLESVEIIFDGKSCVVGADAEGYFPLIFTPNETIFITGQQKRKNEKEF